MLRLDDVLSLPALFALTIATYPTDTGTACRAEGTTDLKKNKQGPNK
jgi:hypothetical protein